MFPAFSGARFSLGQGFCSCWLLTGDAMAQLCVRRMLFPIRRMVLLPGNVRVRGPYLHYHHPGFLENMIWSFLFALLAISLPGVFLWVIHHPGVDRADQLL